MTWGRKEIKATNETFGFARVAGSQPVCVPARSTCYVLAVGGRDCSTTVLEPLQADCGNPLILAAVVNARTFLVAVSNTM